MANDNFDELQQHLQVCSRFLTFASFSPSVSLLFGVIFVIVVFGCAVRGFVWLYEGELSLKGYGLSVL